ncbi:MAG: HNH endonuclease [Candidatus Eisenbacteria bacterium]|nr:HNH endonuclease [Candidatus Eisenbacteria bacterium]
MLSPHLIEATAEDLLTAAPDKTKAQVEQLLAERFPKPDLPTFIQSLAAPESRSDSVNQLAPARVDGIVSESTVLAMLLAAPTPETPAPPPRVAPLAPERFALQVTIDQETRDLLRDVQNLMGNAGSNDVATVLRRALELLKRQLERQKFAATESPRTISVRASEPSRHIPAEVKRAVWERDGGQCTFVSATGHRCEARRSLEFDHIHAFARGGRATVGNIRLRCRAHNRYEAERTFGTEFTRQKRA